MDFFTETKMTHGTNAAIDYERALGGAKGPQNCTNVVRPSISDFISDVEVAARRALSKPLFKRFRAVYVDQLLFEDELTAEEKEAIEQKVGKTLKHRKIYPMSIYFKGKRV